jgi:hypothetical protein
MRTFWFVLGFPLWIIVFFLTWLVYISLYGYCPFSKTYEICKELLGFTGK